MNIDQEHYTIRQLAKLWGLSYNTVLRMFRTEPGVVRMGSKAQAPVKGHRRGYTSWRIPREVAERVYRRGTVPGTPTHGQ